jgi:hypothetical protein
VIRAGCSQLRRVQRLSLRPACSHPSLRGEPRGQRFGARSVQVLLQVAHRQSVSWPPSAQLQARQPGCFLCRRIHEELASGAVHVRGRRIARVSGAPSRDALRGILRDDANRALDRALPAPGDGHTHEERSCAAFNDKIPACWQRSTARRFEAHRQGGPECP